MIRFILALNLTTSSAVALPAGSEAAQTRIPGGHYTPFLLRPSAKSGESDRFRRSPVVVAPFTLDRDLVTNEAFLKFVTANSQWRKSIIKTIFADEHYLKRWKSDLDSSFERNRPVINVSWFAANAFCESRGLTLPTTDQWEYAFHDQGREEAKLREKVLTWYGQPTPKRLASLRSGEANGFGIYDLSSVVWEWTLDFNSFIAGEELRESGGKDKALFCGGGSMGTLDSSDYPAFMRFSFRASLKAAYTTSNLGFRCAGEATP